MMNQTKMSIKVNGVSHDLQLEPRTLLIDLLRDNLKLKGVHRGCSEGECGACTVLLNGAPILSCITLAVQADGGEVLTVEGLAEDEKMQAIIEAFTENYAIQCGYCTPGILLSTYHLLGSLEQPTENQIRTAISGNLCRCTGYVNIVKAIKDVSQKINR
jgi:aerobic-type carbon monoxide dehydrogenase small subunit (CoxS/CutS family)